MQIADILNESILSIPDYLIDANKRIFYLYLLSALVFAIGVYIVRKRAGKNESLLGYLFNRKIWWHSSARLDYGLFVVNRLIKGFLWAPLVFTMVPIAIGLSNLLESTFGALTPLSDDPVVIIGVFTVLLFLFDDLTRFLLHYALHKIPFLWEFHKVHHSALVLTPMTIYRSHPVESFMYACRMALAQGSAVGIGYYLFGPTLSMFDVLGANLFVFMFNIMGSNLRHSHVWWSWGNKIEGWFISPAQHQVHHSDHPAHFDRNLGSALAIWDRMFGTLIKSSEVGRIHFGLGNDQATHTSLANTYFEPFKLAFMKLLPEKVANKPRA